MRDTAGGSGKKPDFSGITGAQGGTARAVTIKNVVHRGGGVMLAALFLCAGPMGGSGRGGP